MSRSLVVGRRVCSASTSGCSGTDPFGPRGARQLDAGAREDRLLPVQRQVVGVLLDRGSGQQAGRGDVAVKNAGRGRFGDDGFAALAGVLRVDVAAHEEPHGLDIQLDVHGCANAAGAGCARAVR